MLRIYYRSFHGRNPEVAVVKLLCACQEATMLHAFVLLATEVVETTRWAPALERN